jgi:aminomethyltransferase
MLKRTPLYECHQKLGARLIEFGGWEMPVQYTGIMDEHQTVRTAAGMFDIAHMGEVRVVGPNAREFLNHVLGNDIRKLSSGQGQYTHLCNERGGVVDDLYAYCLAAREFMLIINASRIDADVAWLKGQLEQYPGRNGVFLESVSDYLGAIAVQGPNAVKFIDQLLPAGAVGGVSVNVPSQLKKNEIAAFRWGTPVVWVARTGYTGEDGFELVMPNDVLKPAWDKLLTIGQPHGLKPAGLGARDTLRTEVCYPLYGHELDENTTPLEAGLGVFVALDKGEFVGGAALRAQKQQGVTRKCVAFRMAEKSAPPRPGYEMFSAGENSGRLGTVASGTLSPTLGVGIGMGYVPTAAAQVGGRLEIEIRGRRFAAEIVKKPFYRKLV